MDENLDPFAPVTLFVAIFSFKHFMITLFKRWWGVWTPKLHPFPKTQLVQKCHFVFIRDYSTYISILEDVSWVAAGGRIRLATCSFISETTERISIKVQADVSSLTPYSFEIW